MQHLKDRTFAIVDVETTGSSPVGGRIIEIGILRIENGVCVETFKSLINPREHVPEWITGLTGIVPESLDIAPTFEDVIGTVERLLRGAVFVAHNARFDYAFIKNEFKRAGRRFNAKCLCTVRLSRALYPRARRHDLTSIIERYKFSCPSRHRAYDDADVLWQFLRHSHDKHGTRLGETIDRLLKRHTLPAFLDSQMVQNLPEAPGIYIFYGEDDQVLYVGKSRNIRYRVLSHFSGDHTASKELAIGRSIVRIEARETAGELSALLLESSLVKSLHPAYNRQLRKRHELVVARRTYLGAYASVELVHTTGITPEDYPSVLGIFKNTSQAKNFLADANSEHKLCSRVLQLEKGNGPCFGYHLETCNGACAGIEDATNYNERFEQAFEHRRLKAWPYAGAIMIEEMRNDTDRHAFILHNWCLLADARTDADGVELQTVAPEFDYDRYKIFARYLRDPYNKKRIKVLLEQEFRKFLTEVHEEEVIQ